MKKGNKALEVALATDEAKSKKQTYASRKI
jgi:hypothetical protein